MVAEFITHTDSRWREFLRLVPHDVYHLPEYVEVCAKHENAEPLGFYATDGGSICLIPLLRKRLPEHLKLPSDWCDLTSPYGYACPLYSDPNNAQQVLAFLSTFCAAADKLSVCSAFLRLHPLIDAKYGPALLLSAFVIHGETVAIDLTCSQEEMWRDTCSYHRHDIRRLKRLNFVPVIDNWAFYSEFSRIYRETMVRVGATATYRFNDDYFANLKAALSDRLHLCCVLAPDGRVAAAGLLTTVDRIIEFHLLGIDAKYFHFAPGKLIVHFMRQWGKEHGYSFLHLGGGVGAENDGLFQFKAGFSPVRKRFQTYRLIANKLKYTAVKLRTRNPDPSTDLESAFFPPYRKTINA